MKITNSFSSIFGFTSPIIKDRGLRFSNIFIFKDETGRPYAQYRIPDKFQKREDFKTIAEFLCKYKIYLDEEVNQGFTIYEIYHYFDKLNSDSKTGPLTPKPLDEYFGEGEKKDWRKADFSNKQQTVENFIEAEEFYTAFLLSNVDWKTPEYLPFPVISRGNLVGVTYVLSDRDKLRNRTEDIKEAGLKAHYRLLLLQLTREYENISPGSKISKIWTEASRSIRRLLGDRSRI